jgi:hypothetical protein
MGKTIGISKEMMSRMIKEMDVNEDKLISTEEWINYIKDTKNNLNRKKENTEKYPVKKKNMLQEYIEHKNILNSEKKLNEDDEIKAFMQNR